MDFNNLESMSSLINNLTGGAGISGLGDLSKLIGLLGNKHSGKDRAGNGFPIILILLLLFLFGNKGQQGFYNQPQYAVCCCRKKHRKHRRRRDCCCDYGYGHYEGYGGYGGCGGYGGQGGFRGSGNIIFIILILLLIRAGKNGGGKLGSCEKDYSSFNSEEMLDTQDDYGKFVEANDEE